MAMMIGRRGRGGPWEWSFGDGEGRQRGGGGRRGPRGRMFAGGELRLLLLKLIGDESRHGYELIKAIEEYTGGNYAPSPGVVYPTLSLLLDEGMIEERADDSPRKAFAITSQGEAELSSRAQEAEALVARLVALDEADDAHRAPPIGRAVGNLFAAMRGRAQSGFDTETVHRVAEILDEAARKIERL
jgi:DNA-binding PadR family transcriptional regulator